MPVLRILFSALAVVVGIVIACFILALGFVMFLLQRLFGRPATMPRFQRVNPRPAASATRVPAGDVIDVEATPVKE
jgi:hypothetical protein